MAVQNRAIVVCAPVLFYSILIAGCSSLENADKKTVGIGIGATACAAAASIFTKNASRFNRALITAGSAAGCGWLGGQIGAYLDEKDREKMNEAAQAALDTGEVQTWDSDENETSGTAEVIPTAPNSQASAADADCRTIRNTVTLADGSEKQDEVTACRNASGRWEMI